MSTLLGLVEYCVIVLEMEVASRGGLRMEEMAGSGELSDVEVRMQVFMGLTKQPKEVPLLAKLSHRNWRSSRGTQADTSSTYPRRRWVMPPLSSLPVLPARREKACCST